MFVAAAAAITVVSAAGFASSAHAITPLTQSAMRDAVESTDVVQKAHWVCRYDWRGFRRCWWVPRRHYHHRPYWWRYGYHYPYWRRYYY
jgi:hypothetical protein